MTQLESKIFDFVESVFGTEAAIKNFCQFKNFITFVKDFKT